MKATLAALALAAGALVPTDASGQDWSARLVGGGGTTSFVALQARKGSPFGIPASYLRGGVRFTGQSCLDSLPARCDLPGDGTLEAAAGVSVPLPDAGPLAAHVDLGGGVAAWHGADPLLEAELRFTAGGVFHFGVRSEAIWMGGGSASHPPPARRSSATRLPASRTASASASE